MMGKLCVCFIHKTTKWICMHINFDPVSVGHNLYFTYSSNKSSSDFKRLLYTKLAEDKIKILI